MRQIVLVLADVTDQPVAVRSQPVNDALKVIDLERHVAQPQLVGHRGGRTGLMSGPHESRELQPGTSIGRTKHDDLGARVRNADDRVQELAFHEHPRALDLETQPNEERRHRVEVRNSDTDMIEALYQCYGPILRCSFADGLVNSARTLRHPKDRIGLPATSDHADVRDSRLSRIGRVASVRVGVEELEVAALVVHHDDPTREYAYNDHKILTAAAEHGWTVLSKRHLFTDLCSDRPCGDAR